MKNFCTIAAAAFLTLTLAVTDADAQRFSKRKTYNSVSVTLNAMNYFGDIEPQSSFTSFRFKSTRPNLGVTYSHRFTPRISVRGGFAWGRVTGDDSKSASVNEEDNIPRFKRNLSFRNDIKELSAVGVFDLFENRGTYLKRADFTPYGFIGVAVFAHNPKAEYKGNFVALQPLGTEGQNSPNAADKGYPSTYSKVQIAIPFGVGVKYKLDRRWDLGFEIGWRKTFTDYLDDVSSNYADPTDLDPGLARALADRSGETVYANAVDPRTGQSYVTGYGQYGDQRGDRTDKDWYIVAGFSLNYIIPTAMKSPKFR